MEFVATLFVMPSPSSPASPPIIKMSILLWCRRAAAARQQGDVANSPKFNMDGAGTGGQMDLNRAEWTEQTAMLGIHSSIEIKCLHYLFNLAYTLLLYTCFYPSKVNILGLRAVECSRQGMEDNQSQNGRITAGCIPGPGGDISSDNLQSFV